MRINKWILIVLAINIGLQRFTILVSIMQII